MSVRQPGLSVSFGTILRGLSNLAENYEQAVPEGQPEDDLNDALWDALDRISQRRNERLIRRCGRDEKTDQP